MSVDTEQPLMEAGLDSLGAVDLRNALIARFGLDFPATATFDFPTIEALAQHIAANTTPSHISQPAWQDSAIVEHDYGPPTKAAVQVVGLACTYPGKFHNVSARSFIVALLQIVCCSCLEAMQAPICLSVQDILTPSHTIHLVRNCLGGKS